MNELWKEKTAEEIIKDIEFAAKIILEQSYRKESVIENEKLGQGAELFFSKEGAIE